MRRLPLLIVLLLFTVLLPVGAAFAYWVTPASDTVPGAQADVLPQGATPGTPGTNAPNGNTVTVSFSQVDTTGDTPITEYTVTRYAVGSSTPAATFECSGSSSPISCQDTGVPDGQWQYTDTPLYGANWVGIESDKSPTVDVDTTTPTVDITYPVDDTTYGTDWAGAVTGTASDPESGITTVDVAIEDATTNLWWGGSSFDQSAQTFVPTTSGATTWSLTLSADVLTSGDAYAVVAQATDGVGNVGTSSTVTYTYNSLQAATPEVATPLLLPLMAILLMVTGYAFTQRRRRRRSGST